MSFVSSQLYIVLDYAMCTWMFTSLAPPVLCCICLCLLIAPFLFTLCTPYVIGPHLLTAPHFSQFTPLLLGSLYFQLLLVALPPLITTSHLIHAPHTLLMHPPIFVFSLLSFFIKFYLYNFLKKRKTRIF